MHKLYKYYLATFITTATTTAAAAAVAVDYRLYLYL